MPGSELCALMGIKADYRGLADAQDARHLDEASVHLAETYDLPLHVVRLFSRISQREKLLSLLQERSVRKNLIREIVQDLYDLQEDKRAAVIEEMMAYSEGWTSGLRFSRQKTCATWFERPDTRAVSSCAGKFARPLRA
jgi:hypothetical protein